MNVEFLPETNQITLETDQATWFLGLEEARQMFLLLGVVLNKIKPEPKLTLDSQVFLSPKAGITFEAPKSVVVSPFIGGLDE